MVREEIWDDEEGRSIASSFFSFVVSFVVSFGGGVDGVISCKILEIRRYGTFCVICPFGLAFIIYLLMGASFGVHRRIGLVRLLYSHNDKVVCIQKEDKNGKQQ